MAAPTLVVPKGNVVRSYFQVKSLGAFVAPTTITCKYALTSSPGSPTSAIVSTDGTGRYHADIDTSSLDAGTYTITWKGVGAAIALIERQVTVSTPTIP